MSAQDLLKPWAQNAREIVRNPEWVAPSRMDEFSQGCGERNLGWNWRTLSAFSFPMNLSDVGCRLDFLSKVGSRS